MDTVASHAQCFAKASLGQPIPTTTLQTRYAFVRKRAPLRRRVIRHHAVRIYSQAGFSRGTVKIKEEEEKSETTESEPSSGTKKLFKLPVPSKLPGTVKLQNKSQSQAKSNKMVFVAGATGKVGSRTVRELLKLGFSVRAGTRNVEKAQALFEDVASSSPGTAGSNDAAPFGIFSPAKLFGFLKPKAGKKLEIVECNLEDPESIEPALGNAGVVVCCIGASEKEVLDVTGPYRIDFKATENLIEAASSAEVSHFILLTSLGTQKFGFPAAVLNLFWGVLVWKAKAEKALIQSGLPYTIVRPGGMERPTDAYKETHNLLLAEADKLFGGQVSNLQVAELLASIVENPDISVSKIVEAIAETTAPLRPIKELLEEIPVKEIYRPEPQNLKREKPAEADVESKKSSKKQEEEKFAKNNRVIALKEREETRIQAEKLAEEKRAQAQKEKEEKRIQAERDQKEKQRLQALRKKYEEEIEAAREKEEAAKSAAAAALEEKAKLEERAAEIQAKAEAAALAASQAKAVETAVLAAARKGNVLSDEEKEKIMESVRLARLPKEAAPAEQPKPSSKKKPPFSFLGRAASSSITTEITTETEPAKKAEKEKDAESKVEAKADKKAVADKRQEEEKLKKEQEAKKLAEAKKREEQERLEKEAKERVEKDAAEAKQKEEAEAKRKEEELAETKKKEEEEKAKKEAEAKKKQEEERAMKEAEAKIKEEELAEAKKKEEEEKAKKEAEILKAQEEEKAKALAEQEEKAKKEAEKLKAQEEEKAKALAEQEEKAKKEAEKLKAQEEEKAKALAEQEEKAKEAEKAQEEERAKALAEEDVAKQATISAAADEEAKDEKPDSPAPRRKGFRWFWQPAEPETMDVEQSTEEEVLDVPIEAKTPDQLPPCPTPLSPYARYPGLKPPARPIASPSAPKPEKVAPLKADSVSSEIKAVDQAIAKVELPSQEEPTVTAEAPSEDLQDDIEERTRKIQETAAREREALEKAQAATIAFKWPWQKSETTEEVSASALQDEKPAASQAPVSLVKEQETASPAITSQDKSNTLPPSSRPLSPYAQFPGLKPPGPPKPSSAPQNGPTTNSKPVETEASASSPLSPYPGFPELKPPTSPAPGGNGAVPAVEAKEGDKLPEPCTDSVFKWPWQQ